jgi:hypothetical protein
MAKSNGGDGAMLDVHAAVRGLVASMANAGAEAVRVERMPDDSVRVQIEYYLYPSCGCGCPCDALPVPGLGGPGLLSGAAANDTEPPPPPAPAPYSDKGPPFDPAAYSKGGVSQGQVNRNQGLRVIQGGVH